MTIIVSFRDWCQQVRVIREDHYSGVVCVFMLWLPVFQAGLCSSLQRCGHSATSKCATWKTKVQINRASQPHSFALSVWQMAWVRLRPWQWRVWWLQRPSVICRNITGWKKSDCLPDTTPSKGSNKVLMKGRKRNCLLRWFLAKLRKIKKNKTYHIGLASKESSSKESTNK